MIKRLILCQKLGIESEGLASPPFPNELGQKIYNHISEKAWGLWLAHQTMLINEYKLCTADKKARDFLREEMQKFLFGGDAQKPPGYTNAT